MMYQIVSVPSGKSSRMIYLGAALVDELGGQRGGGLSGGHRTTRGVVKRSVLVPRRHDDVSRRSTGGSGRRCYSKGGWFLSCS